MRLRGAGWAIAGLALAYLALGAFTALVYRAALGGLLVLAGALVLLGVATAVAWASSARNRSGR